MCDIDYTYTISTVTYLISIYMFEWKLGSSWWCGTL